MSLRVLITFLFFGITYHANAEPIWTEGLTVKSAGYYFDGDYDIIEVSWNETITTGCAATDSENKARMKRVGIINFTKLLYSSILTAQSSNKKISLLLDSSACDEDGASFGGVRIIE